MVLKDKKALFLGDDIIEGHVIKMLEPPYHEKI